MVLEAITNQLLFRHIPDSILVLLQFSQLLLDALELVLSGEAIVHLLYLKLLGLEDRHHAGIS